MREFRLFDIERTASSSDVIVRDKWAIEIDEMENKIAPVRGGMPIHGHVRTVLVLARQS